MASSISNAQQFINFLEPAQVEELKDAIYKSGGYDKLINGRHICSTLKLEKLKTMKSEVPQDGAFLTEWMECKLQKHQIDEPPSCHPGIMLRVNSNAWPKSIQTCFKKFAESKSINQLRMYSHHVILRFILGTKQLPPLGVKTNDNQGSHLCDTSGCLSEHHLCVETREVNYSRRHCAGIDLIIYENTAGECLILQVEPCDHGKQHAEANGDFLKYSCRKINANFIHDDDL